MDAFLSDETIEGDSNPGGIDLYIFWYKNAKTVFLYQSDGQQELSDQKKQSILEEIMSD